MVEGSTFLLHPSAFVLCLSPFLCHNPLGGEPMSARILVIEDEERIASLLQRGLIYEGYRVEAAGDGPSGLSLARDNPPDLVILDWMLPGVDGLGVCRRPRA